MNLTPRFYTTCRRVADVVKEAHSSATSSHASNGRLGVTKRTAIKALYVANIGSAPLLVNGVRVPKKTKQYIKLGDVLTIPGHYAIYRPRAARRRQRTIATIPRHTPSATRTSSASSASRTRSGKRASASRTPQKPARTSSCSAQRRASRKELSCRARFTSSVIAPKNLMHRAMRRRSAPACSMWRLMGAPRTFQNGASPERIGPYRRSRRWLSDARRNRRSSPTTFKTSFSHGSIAAVGIAVCGESRVRTSNALLIAATNSPERLKLDSAKRFPTKLHLPTLAERREGHSAHCAAHQCSRLLRRDAAERSDSSTKARRKHSDDRRTKNKVVFHPQNNSFDHRSPPRQNARGRRRGYRSCKKIAFDFLVTADTGTKSRPPIRKRMQFFLQRRCSIDRAASNTWKRLSGLHLTIRTSTQQVVQPAYGWLDLGDLEDVVLLHRRPRGDELAGADSTRSAPSPIDLPSSQSCRSLR